MDPAQSFPPFSTVSGPIRNNPLESCDNTSISCSPHNLNHRHANNTKDWNNNNIRNNGNRERNRDYNGYSHPQNRHNTHRDNTDDRDKRRIHPINNQNNPDNDKNRRNNQSKQSDDPNGVMNTHITKNNDIYQRENSNNTRHSCDSTLSSPQDLSKNQDRSGGNYGRRDHGRKKLLFFPNIVSFLASFPPSHPGDSIPSLTGPTLETYRPMNIYQLKGNQGPGIYFLGHLYQLYLLFSKKYQAVLYQFIPHRFRKHGIVSGGEITPINTNALKNSKFVMFLRFYSQLFTRTALKSTIRIETSIKQRTCFNCGTYLHLYVMQQQLLQKHLFARILPTLVEFYNDFVIDQYQQQLIDYINTYTSFHLQQQTSSTENLNNSHDFLNQTQITTTSLLKMSNDAFLPSYPHSLPPANPSILLNIVDLTYEKLNALQFQSSRKLRAARQAAKYREKYGDQYASKQTEKRAKFAEKSKQYYAKKLAIAAKIQPIAKRLEKQKKISANMTMDRPKLRKVATNKKHVENHTIFLPHNFKIYRIIPNSLPKNVYNAMTTMQYDFVTPDGQKHTDNHTKITKNGYYTDIKLALHCPICASGNNIWYKRVLVAQENIDTADVGNQESVSAD